MVEDRRNIPLSPQEVLTTAVAASKRLETEAQHAIRKQGDGDTYITKLRTRAILFSLLPDLVGDAARKTGTEIPLRAWRDLHHLAYEADDALETNRQGEGKNDGSFLLGMLDTDFGSEIGDPTRLEKITNKIFPPEAKTES